MDRYDLDGGVRLLVHLAAERLHLLARTGVNHTGEILDVARGMIWQLGYRLSPNWHTARQHQGANNRSSHKPHSAILRVARFASSLPRAAAHPSHRTRVNKKGAAASSPASRPSASAAIDRLH